MKKDHADVVWWSYGRRQKRPAPSRDESRVTPTRRRGARRRQRPRHAPTPARRRNRRHIMMCARREGASTSQPCIHTEPRCYEHRTMRHSCHTHGAHCTQSRMVSAVGSSPSYVASQIESGLRRHTRRFHPVNNNSAFLRRRLPILSRLDVILSDAQRTEFCSFRCLPHFLFTFSKVSHPSTLEEAAPETNSNYARQFAREHLVLYWHRGSNKIRRFYIFFLTLRIRSVPE